LSAAGDAGPNKVATHPELRPVVLLERVVRRDDLVQRKPVRVKRERIDIVVVLVDDEVIAFKNRCPHTGYLMHEARIRGSIVTCLSHLAQFDLHDGHVVAPPMEGKDIACGPLPLYRVIEEEGCISVEIPEE
jgi:nitrite reductase/ring-hydroxylating ferredoxin subunit